MSDAFTDDAREARRARLVGRYYDALAAYLNAPADERRQEVLQAAADADSVVGGHSSRTKLAESAVRQMDLLRSNDVTAWAQLLFGFDAYSPRFQKFKDLSPFAGKFLIGVEYRDRRVQASGEIGLLTSLCLTHIEGKKGWERGDCKRFFLLLSEDAVFADVDVVRAESPKNNGTVTRDA